MNLLFTMPILNEWYHFVIYIALTIILGILYLTTLQSTLQAISWKNRRMAPGKVWLLLIPFFAVIWQFIVVINMADSIRAEADSRGLQISESKPGLTIGLIMCILSGSFFIPLLAPYAGVASMVCWIIYWVKISSYKKILLQGNQTFITAIH